MAVFTLIRRPIFVSLLVLGAALLVTAACGGDDDGGETPAAGETPVGGETPAAGGATAEIKMLPLNTFDRSELTIAADTDVTITADNTDSTHNFAVYTSDPAGGGELIDQTEIHVAPFVDTVTVSLAAGEYFFRCEVHPTIMTGTLIAQ
jgi:plastocyanin